MVGNKDLWIRKIIRLHNQQSPTRRLISTIPPLLYMLESEPSWTWQISHLHLQSWRPTETEQELSFSLVTPFVNMSAGSWLVCIFSIFNCPSSKADRMKLYLHCICLVFEWKAEFFVVEICTIGRCSHVLLSSLAHEGRFRHFVPSTFVYFDFDFG